MSLNDKGGIPAQKNSRYGSLSVKVQDPLLERLGISFLKVFRVGFGAINVGRWDRTGGVRGILFLIYCCF